MFVEWTGVLTAIVAVYAAGLSTYTLLVNQKDRSRQIRVKLSAGFFPQGPGPSPMLFIEASNPGHRTVTLNSVGIILPDGKMVIYPKPVSNVSFPHPLEEGKGCSVWTPLNEFIGKLRHEGYGGKVKLVGFYRDQLGQEYSSKKFDLDIDALRE